MSSAGDQPIVFATVRSSVILPDMVKIMLREFLIANRGELVRKCREKAAARFAPAEMFDVADHGVPLFLQQLIDALTNRPSVPANDGNPEGRIPFPAEIGRSAGLHGADLFRRGFTVDEVVHGYGDVCQAVTEMAIEAIESNCVIDPDDFRILNGCLDNAIAGAVTAFAQGLQNASDHHEDEHHERRIVLQLELRRLVSLAIQAFTAMRSSSTGLAGATGGLLMHALTGLQSLAEQPVVEGDAAAQRRASKCN